MICVVMHPLAQCYELSMGSDVNIETSIESLFLFVLYFIVCLRCSYTHLNNMHLCDAIFTVLHICNQGSKSVP